MRIKLTTSFEKKAKKYIKKNPQLDKAIRKQLKILVIDDKHPSLRLHKLEGKRSNQYAIWIKGDLRAIAVKKGDNYIFHNLITHDEY